MGFRFTRLSIPSVILVNSDSYPDKRGFFSEVYRKNEFEEYGIGPFVQENYSSSVKNVIRGLHFQTQPMEVGKLVSCPHGKIFDVAVDLRLGSSTFGAWLSVTLENGNGMLWIPPGFAHGFCTLSDTANVLYRQTEYYSKEHDKSLRWNDPYINIDWPVKEPIMSDKDTYAPLLKDLKL